jgi:predicted chitinase
MRRLRAVLLAAVVGAVAIIAPVAIAPSASAHGWITSPPSRQDHCAKGTTSFDCGGIKYEPQSVEAPKGSMKCSGGSGFSILDDASKPWPRTQTGTSVTFQWNLTAAHNTSTWEYFVDGVLFKTFNQGGAQPPSNISHTLTGLPEGNHTILARWNVSNTVNAFYNCVALKIGSGGTDPGNPGNPGNPSSFVVSEAQFNQMFPNRNAFYSYQGLVDALSAYPGFATTGGTEVAKREAAAFLANVNHETGGLVYIKEINTANYPHYCDYSQPYGCPAGQSAYYGKGPVQLSWNYNYKAAGDALGIDLLNNPYLVEQNSAVAWKTGLWFWNTQSGAGSMSGHQAIVSGAGFGESIRSINGSIECNGGNPAQVQSRVTAFQRFAQILGTTTGANLYC